jgi:hypothetical protein
MQTPIQIINRIDEIFNPASSLSVDQAKNAMLALREEVGDDLWLFCWITSHRVQAAMASSPMTTREAA